MNPRYDLGFRYCATCEVITKTLLCPDCNRRTRGRGY